MNQPSPAKPGQPLAQRLAVQMQLHLPGTVGRLLKQVRDLERLAPLFVQAGLVRPVRRPAPLTVRTAGIATRSVVARALGGFLYASAAVRVDLAIHDNVLATTGQHSTCEIDDIDFEDQSKRFQLLGVRQAYEMADAAIRSRDPVDLILLDCPLVLNRSMVPPTEAIGYSTYRSSYESTLAAIEAFWRTHRERLFPWNPDGTVVAGIAAERFGAIVQVAQQDLRTPEGRGQVLASDGVDVRRMADLLGSEPVIAGVGPRRFVNGILGHHTRTAAFRMQVATPRMEPSEVVDLGVIGFHFRAGPRILPRLVQVIGEEPGWGPVDLDRLAGFAMGLCVAGGAAEPPLPIQLATRELDALDPFLGAYAAAVRDGMERKGVEDAWLADLETFDSSGANP